MLRRWLFPLSLPNYYHLQNIDVNEMIDGRTPLHYAADYGQDEVVRYLLEKGADANVSSVLENLHLKKFFN